MERLFQVIDERARHALFSIAADRSAARTLIESDYPVTEQVSALAALGDEPEVPAALFAHRCGIACQETLRSVIAAPTDHHVDGDETVLTTARGTLRVYRQGEGHWWGIVWQSAALDQERNRANQDPSADRPERRSVPTPQHIERRRQRSLKTTSRTGRR